MRKHGKASTSGSKHIVKNQGTMQPPKTDQSHQESLVTPWSSATVYERTGDHFSVKIVTTTLPPVVTAEPD